MAKYEPPREDGKKGYVVSVSDWARRYDRTVYAEDAATARRMVWGGRPPTGVYITGVKRVPASDALKGGDDHE